MYQISHRSFPSQPLETYAVLDTAINRAKKISMTIFRDLIVVDAEEPGRNKVVRAFVDLGVVQWAVKCKSCKGVGGDSSCYICSGIGMVPDLESWA